MEWMDDRWMDGKYASLSFTDEVSRIKKMPLVSELRQIIGLTLKSCNSQKCHGEQTFQVLGLSHQKMLISDWKQPIWLTAQLQYLQWRRSSVKSHYFSIKGGF